MSFFADYIGLFSKHVLIIQVFAKSNPKHENVIVTLQGKKRVQRLESRWETRFVYIKTGGFILFFKLLFLGVIFLKNIKTQVLKSIGQIIVWSLVICFIFLLTITRYSGSYSCHTILSRSRSP